MSMELIAIPPVGVEKLHHPKIFCSEYDRYRAFSLFTSPHLKRWLPA
jgi:hypothetical protein